MLSKFHPLRHVLALDLNPHSVLVAKVCVCVWGGEEESGGA